MRRDVTGPSGLRRPVVMAATIVTIAAVLISCGGPPEAAPPSPPTGSLTLMPRHHDQVCRTAGRAPTDLSFGEIFDTLGLRDAARTIGRDVPTTNPRRPPYLDFIVHYDRAGSPVATGVWSYSVPDSVAEPLAIALRSRVRTLSSGLLSEASYRAQIAYRVPISLDLVAPAECMPHIRHTENLRPTGLPDGIRTQGGTRWIPDGDTLTAVVRITVGPEGSVREIEDVRGSPSALARTREVVPLLEFDPPLRNGRPVEGVLLQSFSFPPRAASRWQAPPP